MPNAKRTNPYISSHACRNLDDLGVLLGFFTNELINVALKHSAKQPRPSLCHEKGLGVCNSYGYPSSHSQCMWYFITIGTLVRPSAAAWLLCVHKS
jgi:membrane-associated phospholipid phosphatase